MRCHRLSQGVVRKLGSFSVTALDPVAVEKLGIRLVSL